MTQGGEQMKIDVRIIREADNMAKEMGIDFRTSLELLMLAHEKLNTCSDIERCLQSIGNN